MLDQLRPNSTYFDAACRWLKRNEERWQSWLPDPTKCFAHFGMYNTTLDPTKAASGLHKSPTVPRTRSR